MEVTKKLAECIVNTDLAGIPPEAREIGKRVILDLLGVALAGSKQIGDDAFNEIFHPIAERLLEKCDGVLRIGGPSTGADLMVETSRKLGGKIFYSLDEIPNYE